MKLSSSLVAAAAALALTANGALAQSLTNVSFVNGLALDGGLLDKSSGSNFDRRVGYFSRSSQGQGISALVALGNDKFLVLERNNRGVGVGATFATADKNVYQIDLAGASDVTGIDLDSGTAFTAVSKGAKLIDLDADTLAALGNKSPEKWEGLAVGPKLANGKHLVLAGTDNDHSVTRTATVCSSMCGSA